MSHRKRYTRTSDRKLQKINWHGSYLVEKTQEELRQSRLRETVEDTLKKPDIQLQDVLAGWNNLVSGVEKLNQWHIQAGQAFATKLQDGLRSIITSTTWVMLEAFLDKIRNFQIDLGQVIDNYFRNFLGEGNVQVGTLWKVLPNLAELARELKEFGEALQDADDSLNQSAYSFVINSLNLSTTIQFAHVSPRVRAAAFTNRFLSITRSSEFETKIQTIFSSAPILRRRWRIIQRALKAHINRDYLASITLLLPQLEGIIADTLIVREYVVRDKQKLYWKGRVGRNGKPIEIKGLHKLIEDSDLTSHYVLDTAANMVMNRIAGERNGILHGRNVRYDQAQRSTQLLLLVYLFANELAAFVTGYGWNAQEPPILA
jgi:hypothetical protein